MMYHSDCILSQPQDHINGEDVSTLIKEQKKS